MERYTRKSLQGLRVVCFESRRAKEMAELIRRYDGEPIVAPSMRKVPLSENRAALDLLPQIEAARFDILILMTGVGTKALNEILLTQFTQERIVAALNRLQLIARGPKPIGALKELGLQAALTVPEPNTWREILSTLDAALDVHGKWIAIQEYGIANAELIAALEQRGALVTSIPIYRWALPEDLAPLRGAIEKDYRRRCRRCPLYQRRAGGSSAASPHLTSRVSRLKSNNLPCPFGCYAISVFSYFLEAYFLQSWHL